MLAIMVLSASLFNGIYMMRLLKFGGRGDLSLTDDLLRNPFAYLGADGDEVTFKDLENQSYKSRGPEMGLSTAEQRGGQPEQLRL